MKCAMIKGKKLIEISDIEEPKIDGEKVIVDIKKAGICGSDIHYWDSGKPKGLVLGHEFSGIVVNPGNRIDLKAGDRVTALPISPCGKCHACKKGNPQFCIHTWDEAVGLSVDNPGGFTSRIAVRPDMVIKLPKSITDEEAAMVEPTAVSYHAALLANIKVGEKVLIVGGGVIGLLAAMFAKMEGATYVALCETNEKRGRKAVALGVADEYLDAFDKKLPEKIIKKTGEGFDKVIECCGNSGAVSSALSYVKTGGQVILVGVSLEPVAIPTVIAVLHEIDVQGAIGYTKEEFEECIKLIEQNEIDVLKFLDSVVPLRDTQKSFEKLTKKDNDAIKILIDPNM